MNINLGAEAFEPDSLDFGTETETGLSSELFGNGQLSEIELPKGDAIFDDVSLEGDLFAGPISLPGDKEKNSDVENQGDQVEEKAEEKPDFFTENEAELERISGYYKQVKNEKLDNTSESLDLASATIDIDKSSSNNSGESFETSTAFGDSQPAFEKLISPETTNQEAEEILVKMHKEQGVPADKVKEFFNKVQETRLEQGLEAFEINIDVLLAPESLEISEIAKSPKMDAESMTALAMVSGAGEAKKNGNTITAGNQRIIFTKSGFKVDLISKSGFEIALPPQSSEEIKEVQAELTKKEKQLTQNAKSIEERAEKSEKLQEFANDLNGINLPLLENALAEYKAKDIKEGLTDKEKTQIEAIEYYIDKVNEAISYVQNEFYSDNLLVVTPENLGQAISGAMEKNNLEISVYQKNREVLTTQMAEIGEKLQTVLAQIRQKAEKPLELAEQNMNVLKVLGITEMKQENINLIFDRIRTNQLTIKIQGLDCDLKNIDYNKENFGLYQGGEKNYEKSVIAVSRIVNKIMTGHPDVPTNPDTAAKHALTVGGNSGDNFTTAKVIDIYDDPTYGVLDTSTGIIKWDKLKANAGLEGEEALSQRENLVNGVIENKSSRFMDEAFGGNESK